MRQWIVPTFVQIIVCRLFGASHYLNKGWFIVNWALRNKFQWIFFYQGTKLCIHYLKSSSAKGGPFFPGGDELTQYDILSSTAVTPALQKSELQFEKDAPNGVFCEDCRKYLARYNDATLYLLINFNLSSLIKCCEILAAILKDVFLS